MSWNYDTKALKTEEKLVKARAERSAPDPACQLRRSTNETSLRAGEFIIEGNKATQAQPLFV